MTNVDYYESIPLNQLSAFALSELLKVKPEYASRCDFSCDFNTFFQISTVYGDEKGARGPSN